MKANNPLTKALKNAHAMRDKAIICGDIKAVNRYNDLIEDIEQKVRRSSVIDFAATPTTGSSRFSRPKMKPNVSRDAPAMGYAKPIQHQRISYKYNCMVTGTKRMEPCAGCGNPKGCLSNSMQYKEHQT